ncbi:MAG: DUF1987 domain-containing protein [Treponema sp.]|nr:DUF1987 domain-containing protein [Treponema sp.]
MTYHLERQKTTSTPYILIDEEKCYMKMEGCSFHEDVVEFFSQVNIWLDSFLMKDFGTFTFDCEMEYFNSSTVKVLFNMLMKMDNCANEKPNNKIIVNWITDQNNEIILECGEDLKEEITALTFNIVAN